MSTVAAISTSPDSDRSVPIAADDESRYPDLIFSNAQVVTVDDAFSIAEAVAVARGLIVAVGPDVEVAQLAGPETIVVDLGGRTLVPGFVDTHTHLMQSPAPDIAAMRGGQDELIASGITTAGMPTVFPDELDAFRELDDAGEIRLRAHLYVAYNSVCGDRDLGDFYLANTFHRDPDRRLALAGVKIFADGGACGGPAMSVEYLDSVPEYLYNSGWSGNGDLYVSAEEIASVLVEVDDAGGQTLIHAIGDVAIATALSGVALAGDLTNPRNIHHLSFSTMVDPDLLASFGELGLIPVVQMMPWARACEPGRTELWESIIVAEALAVVEDRSAISAANPGIRWAWHGDGPWIVGSPLQQMFSLVAGGSADGTDVCYPEAWEDFETSDIEEALRMTTINAAAAMGFEHHFGSIEVGKAADLAILENDIFDPDPEVALAWNRPVATIIDGATEYCTGDLCSTLEGRPVEPDRYGLPPTNECVVAPAGLVGWWPGDGSAVDITGDNSGALIDGASFGEGAVGGAFSINRGAVVLSSLPPIDDAFTIEAWIVLDGADFDDFQSVFNNDRFFLRKNNAAEGNGFAVFVKLADGSVEPRAQSIRVSELGVWTHLAATWDGADLKLYVDGVLEGSASRQGELLDTATPPQIGRGEQAGVDGPQFVGRIDEFSIYEVALRADVIASISNAGTGGKCKP